MTAMPASNMVSVGDLGALDSELEPSLSEVWVDRDLGWLDFNQRVLEEAFAEGTPLLERAKFLAIFTSNLDEFFMKRMAVLRHATSPESAELRKRLREKLLPLLSEQSEYFRRQLVPDLDRNGIFLRGWDDLTKAQMDEAISFFDDQVSAAVTPLVINPKEGFPFLSNLSTSLIFALYDPTTAQDFFARVKIPSDLRQWVQLKSDVPDNSFLFLPLHEVIRANLNKLYKGMALSGITLVRLSRQAEVVAGDLHDASWSEQVQAAVRKRRYQPVVRLEFAEDADPAVENLLREHFRLSPEDVYRVGSEIDFTSLFEIAGLNVPTLRDKPWNPQSPLALRDQHKSIFSAIRSGDFIVHHPYESFDDSVESFIEAGSKDPDTVAIKMTVYRVGNDTPFVKSLIKAAESGKQVACVIELNARFDEERNLHWAAALEKAGAHVEFGVEGLKIHAKTAIVVRKESGNLRTYTHIATGNYHVRTARLYADLGLFTCDSRVTGDVVNLFHYLTGRSDPPDYRALLVAPNSMRSRFLELIQREIDVQQNGGKGRIIAKFNQMEDPEIIRALLRASQAGVSIDLIIRGFCCLKPGVSGQSENIRVRSIIGRFLEHSRIYYFGAGATNPLEGDFYIGSADWMFRNLSRRVEVVTPILAAGPRQRLWEILEINLNDTKQAWLMDTDGSYSRALHLEAASQPTGTHEVLMQMIRTSD